MIITKMIKITIMLINLAIQLIKVISMAMIRGDDDDTEGD